MMHSEPCMADSACLSKASAKVDQIAKTCPVLSTLNHVSFLCANVCRTKTFYRDMLGFIEVKRPDSFKFEGSWLIGSGGIAIHLISGQPPLSPRPINPQDVHISFVCSDLDAIEAHLAGNEIPFVRATVYEGGMRVTQVFCHDPDNNMLEFCNCDCLPMLPLSSLQEPMHGSLTNHKDGYNDQLGRASTDSSQPSSAVLDMPCGSSESQSD